MTQCPSCGSVLPDSPDRFCANCGADLGPPVPPPPPPPSGESPIERTLPRGSEWAPAGGAREGTPWERRASIGFASALIETTQQVLTAPTAFFQAMRVEGGIGSPLLYALILGYAGIVVTAIYEFVMTAVIGTSIGSLGELGGGENEAFARMLPALQGGVGLGAKLFLGPVILLVMLFVLAGIMHLGLMLVGGATRGFEATFRVLCYSEATAIFQVIPLCGQLIGSVYMLVLLTIGLAEAHGTTRGKALVAVLLPVLACCCCIGAIVFFVVTIVGQQLKMQ
jgi:hypothetical protein